MLLTPAEMRQLTNAAHDVADEVLETYIARAQEWAEEIALAPLERRVVENVSMARHSGYNRLSIPGVNPELLEVRVENQDVTHNVEPVSRNMVELVAEQGQRVYVRYRAGYDVAPPALKYILAVTTLVLLQEAGYARTESWAGLETISVSTVDGTRTLRRLDFGRWLMEQLAPYSWMFPVGIV